MLPDLLAATLLLVSPLFALTARLLRQLFALLLRRLGSKALKLAIAKIIREVRAIVTYRTTDTISFYARNSAVHPVLLLVCVL